MFHFDSNKCKQKKFFLYVKEPVSIGHIIGDQNLSGDYISNLSRAQLVQNQGGCLDSPSPVDSEYSAAAGFDAHSVSRGVNWYESEFTVAPEERRSWQGWRALALRLSVHVLRIICFSNSNLS
jgi:hypothetical protein